MGVCCENLMLGALSSRGALSALVGVLFKQFGLFLNMLCVVGWVYWSSTHRPTSSVVVELACM
jgi:hypothetical protein